jgi:thioredoxin reductase (NADPH)
MCDGPLYGNKDVAIIGCGNSGLQEGEALLKYVRSVTFVDFVPFITGERILQERLQKTRKANFLLNHILVSIHGNSMVTSITVRDVKTGGQKEIQVSGVFIYAGLLPNSDFVKRLIKLDKEGFIVTNEMMATSVPGIFAAGDVRSNQIRQISTACGSAVTAVINAERYVRRTIGSTNE